MEFLYMFAIMPPETLMESIQKERLAYANQYKFYRALKPPVHITIYAPFWAKNEIEDRLAGVRNLVNR